MKVNLGYRALLSCEIEAFDKLISQVPCPEFTRIGTWAICNICNKPYVKHPYIIPQYMLHKLCDGRIVKT